MPRTTPPSHCLRSGQWSPCGQWSQCGGQWWPVEAGVPGIISIHIVIVPLPILGHLSTPDTRYTATAASGRAFQICGIKSVNLSNNTGWKVWLVHIALRARDFDEQDYFLSISANLFWFENDSQIFHKLSCAGAGLKQKQESRNAFAQSFARFVKKSSCAPSRPQCTPPPLLLLLLLHHPQCDHGFKYDPVWWMLCSKLHRNNSWEIRELLNKVQTRRQWGAKKVWRIDVSYRHIWCWPRVTLHWSPAAALHCPRSAGCY